MIIDLVRAWPAPFNPTGVVEEAAALLKTYRCYSVTGDRYAGEWPREAFRAHGIRYTVSTLDRSALYLEMLPRVNAGTVELPNDATLLRELRGLERRRGTAGRDRIDHRSGSHDDRANTVAGVLSAIGRRRPPGDFESQSDPLSTMRGCKDEALAPSRCAVRPPSGLFSEGGVHRGGAGWGLVLVGPACGSRQQIGSTLGKCQSHAGLETGFR